MTDLANIVEFLAETEKLKAVSRSNLTLDAGRFENSAEHSWQAALTAVLLKDYVPYEVSMDRVLTMLLIHDLGEIYAGDTLVFDEKGKADSFERELASLERSFGLLPITQKDAFFDLWEEFEKGQTNEARYARVIDALIPLLSHLAVAPNDYNPNKLTKEMVSAKKAFIQAESADLWELAKAIIQKSVDKGLYRN